MRCEIGPSCAGELRQAELKASMDLAASEAIQRCRLGELRSKVAGELLSKVAAIRRFSAEERKDGFARYWSTRQQASGPWRGVPRPTVLDGVI